MPLTADPTSPLPAGYSIRLASSPSPDAVHAHAHAHVHAHTPTGKGIATLVRTTWTAHFGHTVPPADLAVYLAGGLSDAAITKEVEDPRCRFVILERERVSGDTNEDAGDPVAQTEVVGVAQLVLDSTDPSLPPLPPSIPSASLVPTSEPAPTPTYRDFDVGIDVDIDVELRRFYLSSELHGSGLAQTLLCAAEAEARALAAALASEDASQADGNGGGGGGSGSGVQARAPARVRFWLGVWEHNARGERFYAKSGFVRVGEHGFFVGDTTRRDWIMCKVLP